MTEASPRRLGVFLFTDFELLDAFGPLEMFGSLFGSIDVHLVAQHKGPVKSAQGPQAVAEFGFDDCPHLDLVLVPGGMGTRVEIDKPATIDWLRQRVGAAEVAMTVCTGTALFARAGVLDGRRAPSLR